jgi:hypothetical protein
MKSTYRTYHDMTAMQLDITSMANAGWKTVSTTTEDTRKGSWGWVALWAVIGLFTIVGFIGCLFTFPRGELTYHVTYEKQD